MPTFEQVSSNGSQITINWIAGTSSDTPVTGYKLYSDLGLQADFYMIYDGTGNINKLA